MDALIHETSAPVELPGPPPAALRKIFPASIPPAESVCQNEFSYVSAFDGLFDFSQNAEAVMKSDAELDVAAFALGDDLFGFFQGYIDGLFEKEVFVNCGRSMLKRFQMGGKTLEGEVVTDRLLLTH